MKWIRIQFTRCCDMVWILSQDVYSKWSNPIKMLWNEIQSLSQDVVKWLNPLEMLWNDWHPIKMLWNDWIHFRCCQMIKFNNDVLTWSNSIKILWNDQLHFTTYSDCDSLHFTTSCEMIDSNQDVVTWFNPIKMLWNDRIQ